MSGSEGMVLDKQTLTDLLAKYGQQEVLQFWDQLEPSQCQRLADQIVQIDLPLINQLVTGADIESDWGALAARAESPSAIRLDASDNIHSAAEAISRGEQALRECRVAVLLVAGGQGTRLGFPHPKGLFPLGPLSHRTLLEIHVDRLRAIASRYGVSIPLYLMTSPATHEETVRYFKQHDRLGLAPDELRVFCQGTMPAVDADSGKLLLAERDSLALSPDGHGGTLAALDREGCLSDMQRRGITQVFYFQVDNPMVSVGDPEYLGYHLLANSEMTSLVVAKQDPRDRVGNLMSIDGHLQVIEYIDLPDEAAERRAADGSLAIWAGSIAVHLFSVDFLRRVASQADSLPFHRALKKVPHFNLQGGWVDPSEPNAIKFERFIFDLLPSARDALVIEIRESDGFAPLKNAPGASKDTAEAVQAAMVAQQTRWLREAGVAVDEGRVVEINPRFAMGPKEIAEKITRGTRINEDTYFSP